MEYDVPTWELSNINPDDIEGGNNNMILFKEPGLYTVKIVDCHYHDEFTAPKPKLIDTYGLTIECVDEGQSLGARGNLTYWVKNAERTKFSENTLGTLRSLGKALFGDDFSQMIPAPAAVKGGVVVAEIKLSNPDALGRMYPKVYHWMAASKDAVETYSDIKQYYRGKE